MATLMTSFDFEKPKDLQAAFKLIAALEKDNKDYVFGGGNTDLLPTFKKGMAIPDTLVSLTGIKDLKGITIIDSDSADDINRVRIGSATRINEIVSSELILQYFPELSRVAGLVANPQIRNQATIGGNILVDNRCIYINQSDTNRTCHSQCFKAGGDVCHLVKSAKKGDETLCQARFVSDTAPILVLLDASLIVQNNEVSRVISIKDFYLKDGIESNCLSHNDILVAIEIPLGINKKIHYEKLAIRKTLDFASIGVAVALSDEIPNSSNQNKNDKRAKSASLRNLNVEISFTGIQTLPGYLSYKRSDYSNTEELIDHACRQANEFSLVYQQDFFPRAYRKKMIDVFIKRCFEQLTGNQ